MFRLTIANQAWEPTSQGDPFRAIPPLVLAGAPGAAHPNHWCLPTSPSECAAPPNVAGRDDVRIKAESNAQNKQNTQGGKLELDKEILAESNGSTNEETADE